MPRFTARINLALTLVLTAALAGGCGTIPYPFGNYG